MSTPEQRLTLLSYGAGQDSTCMLYLYIHSKKFREQYAPGRFLVIMADPGDEHDHTYEHVEFTKELCNKHGIEFVFITNDMGYHPKSWPGLREFYRLKNAVGSKCFPKTCTSNLKLVPIYKYFEDWLGREYGVDVGRKKGYMQYAAKYGKIDVLIGIAAGEEKRMAEPSDKDPLWRRTATRIVYPLIHMGLDRRGCQEYMRSVNLPIPYPSNCMLCPFMSKIELIWLWRNYPEDFLDFVDIEKNKLKANAHLGDRNMGVWGKKTLPEVFIDAMTRYGHMTDEELNEYKFSHGCTGFKM